MIRVTLVWLFVAGLSIYAWKDWFRSLCGLILLMAVLEHPDMPKTLFGIQGLSPWNILFVAVLVGWAVSRRPEGRKWDLPPHMAVLLLLYLAVVLVGFGRMFLERHATDLPGSRTLISEYLFNTVKWVIPGLLMFDGCRTRARFTMAIVCVVGVYLMLGLLVIRWIPLSYAVSGEHLAERSQILIKELGYHRSNLSMMLAGASWAAFAARVLASQRLPALALTGASLLLAFAQALTAGRSGYATWAAVGLILCLLRWRRYLLFVPLVLALVVWLVPGAVERFTEGFSPESRDLSRAEWASDPELDDEPDDYTITSGRTLIWPFVIEKIEEAPLFGYGRLAMKRTGLSAFLWQELGEAFPHPHNAYLEMLLDNGLIGFAAVMAFFAVALHHALSLFLDSRSRIFTVAGGVACALGLALLFSSVGNHSFYPREGTVGMWCAMGLMLRVWVERRRVDALARARARLGRRTSLQTGVRPTLPWEAEAPQAARAWIADGAPRLDRMRWGRAR